ncbi:MAG: hypothetical protein HUU28_11870 [Planctomycetaceae bacterium]|nr:hypothetical protein [Planctomycetaceae bacterium]
MLPTLSLVLAAQLVTSPVPQEAAAQSTWTQEKLEATAREIQLDIERLRGQKFPSAVKVQLASKADLRKYAVERMEKTETPEKLSADTTIAKLLGVVPRDMDVMAETMRILERQVVGFYDPDSDSFSLMDTCPVGLARMTMAHELAHALDDQLWGIDTILAGLGKDTDAQLAYWGVVEGSATIVGNRWQIEHMAELDATGAADMMKGVFDTAPQWLWKPLVGNYLVGASFLQRKEDWKSAQMGSAPTADVERAFKNPPASCEMVLHPEKYWDESKRDLPKRLALAAGSVPAEWKVLREDTFGELYTAILTLPPAKRGGVDMSNPMAMLGLRFTTDAAKGWGGDRVALLAKGDARFLQWETVWDTQQDADEFLAALAAQLTSMRDNAKTLGEGGTAELEVVATAQPPRVRVVVHHGVDPKAKPAPRFELAP